MMGDASPGGARPRVSVVIVNWNGLDYLEHCLDTVVDEEHEVLVVDNGSTDGSVERLRPRYPQVRWIADAENRGFAAAANRGLGCARGDFVLFLNPDARSSEAALSAAIEVLSARAEVGLVGVALRDAEGKITPTVEPFFSFRALRRGRWEKRVEAPEGREPVEIDWCHGAFLVGRRVDLLAWGGFDERYFLYAEDMDLCHRVHESGRCVVYLPWVSVMHEGNRSGRVAFGERRAAAIFSSSLKFYARHHGLAACLALRLAAAGTFGTRALVLWLRRAPEAPRYIALTAVALGLGPESHSRLAPSRRVRG